MINNIIHFFRCDDEQLVFLRHLLVTYVVVFSLSILSIAADVSSILSAKASELHLSGLIYGTDHTDLKILSSPDSESNKIGTYEGLREVETKVSYNVDNLNRGSEKAAKFEYDQGDQEINYGRESGNQELALAHSRSGKVSTFRNNTSATNSNANQTSTSISNSLVNTTSPQDVLASLGIQTNEESLLEKLKQQARLQQPSQVSIPAPANTQAANIETFKQLYPDFFKQQETEPSRLNLNKLEPIAPGSLSDPINCPDVNRYFFTPEARAGARTIQIARGCI